MKIRQPIMQTFTCNILQYCTAVNNCNFKIKKKSDIFSSNIFAQNIDCG